MELIFNDATKLQVQAVIKEGGMLLVKTISATKEELKEKFSDEFATKRMWTEERGSKSEPYEGYTSIDHLREYTGGILGVAMKRMGETIEERIERTEKELEDLKENGIQAVETPEMKAAVEVSRINAQNFDDTDAITVKDIYEQFENLIGKTVKQGYKLLHEGTLYKTRQPDMLIQEQYVPGTAGAESLFEKIDETHAGTIDDPIPYNGNMELEKGKYYVQYETVYECTNGSGQAVTHSLADLIGIYVEIAE